MLNFSLTYIHNNSCYIKTENFGEYVYEGNVLAIASLNTNGSYLSITKFCSLMLTLSLLSGRKIQNTSCYSLFLCLVPKSRIRCGFPQSVSCLIETFYRGSSCFAVRMDARSRPTVCNPTLNIKSLACQLKLLIPQVLSFVVIDETLLQNWDTAE